MIKLETITSVETQSPEESERMIVAIRAAAEEQKKANLGYPEEAVAILLEQYSAPVLAQNFPEVRKPSRLHFSPFMQKFSYYTYAEYAKQEGEEDPSSFPTLAQVELSGSNLSKLSMTVNGVHKSAALPLIPRTVQEIIRRVKETVPTVKLHILFKPQWERTPNPDPVIIGEAAGRFFEIARWDGDKDLIAEFLESVQNKNT